MATSPNPMSGAPPMTGDAPQAEAPRQPSFLEKANQVRGGSNDDLEKSNIQMLGQTVDDTIDKLLSIAQMADAVHKPLMVHVGKALEVFKAMKSDIQQIAQRASGAGQPQGADSQQGAGAQPTPPPPSMSPTDATAGA